MDGKEITIRDFKFKIEKMSFLKRCNLRKLAKGIGPGNWLMGVAEDDFIRAQTKYYDRKEKDWITIPDSIFDELSDEEGKELLKQVNQFNEDFQKVQSQEQNPQN